MKHQRNVDGLRQNAQKKREEAIARTQQAIEQLRREKRPINFKVVAETAEVSTAWLYKEPDIKAQIEYLRDAGTRKQKSVPPQQKASDASKDAKYQALKQRLQKVEGENKGLREHLEVVHGQMRVLSQENESQHKEIERLTKLLEEPKDPNLSSASLPMAEPITSVSKITDLTDRKGRSISEKILVELKSLEIPLNSTLTKKIKSADSESTVLDAIEAFKEARQKSEIPNPGGWLVRAIDEKWKANKTGQESSAQDTNRKPDIFTVQPAKQEDFVPIEQFKLLSQQLKKPQK